MKVWGITVEELERIKNNVAAEYGYNVRYKRIPEPVGKAISFTLTVVSSKLDGSRRSQDSGGKVRKVSAACWHVHRDLFERIFAINPDARVQTAIADYRGSDDFYAKYPQTGAINVGSLYQPLSARNACNCAGGIGDVHKPHGHGGYYKV